MLPFSLFLNFGVNLQLMGGIGANVGEFEAIFHYGLGVAIATLDRASQPGLFREHFFHCIHIEMMKSTLNYFITILQNLLKSSEKNSNLKNFQEI